MACRIGITTNPEKREQEWRQQHPYLYHWRILGQYNSKRYAQEVETIYAKQYDCIASPGGSGQEMATWYVYMFEF